MRVEEFRAAIVAAFADERVQCTTRTFITTGKRGKSLKCCPIGAVYATQKFGIGVLLGGNAPALYSVNAIDYVAEGFELPRSFVYGFIDGFDGNAASPLFAETAANDPENHGAGMKLGKEMRYLLEPKKETKS